MWYLLYTKQCQFPSTNHTHITTHTHQPNAHILIHVARVQFRLRARARISCRVYTQRITLEIWFLRHTGPSEWGCGSKIYIYMWWCVATNICARAQRWPIIVHQRRAMGTRGMHHSAQFFWLSVAKDEPRTSLRARKRANRTPSAHTRINLRRNVRGTGWCGATENASSINRP